MNCKTYQFGESLKIFRNIFGDSTRIKEHRCPRCKAKIWFNSDEAFEESMKKPFLTCPTCFAPYKINLDEEKKIIVEKLTQQVNIPIEVTHPSGDTWNVYEPSITDKDYELLENAVKLIKNVKTWAVLDGILGGFGDVGLYYGMFDSMSGMGWGIYAPPPSSDAVDAVMEQSLFTAFSELYRLYHIYPFQVRQILTRCGIEKVLVYMSTTCPKCNMVIPTDRIDNCPFCKKNEKIKESSNYSNFYSGQSYGKISYQFKLNDWKEEGEDSEV